MRSGTCAMYCTRTEVPALSLGHPDGACGGNPGHAKSFTNACSMHHLAVSVDSPTSDSGHDANKN